jgi:hypothetical protein
MPVSSGLPNYFQQIVMLVAGYCRLLPLLQNFD